MNRQEIAEAYAKTELQDNHAPIGAIVAAAFLDGIDYAEHHPHWISVEDELPKPGERVVVLQDAYGNFSYTACYFQSANQHGKMVDFHVKSDAYIGISKNAEVTLGSITHWMHLPQAPEEGGEQ